MAKKNKINNSFPQSAIRNPQSSFSQSTICNPRIKMCGMTRVEDALAAAQLGIDAIGLIFYKPSPRYVSIEQAKKIIDALPPFVTVTGVFVDASSEEVQTILQQIPLDLLQFHGHESATYCRSFHKPYIKMISMNEIVDWERIQQDYSDAKGFLLDQSKLDQPGGTGEIFDWGKIPKKISKPIILAGGLTPENVAAAINQVKPFAVDVTSGVEANKGIKDFKKMMDFIKAVKGTAPFFAR